MGETGKVEAPPECKAPPPRASNSARRVGGRGGGEAVYTTVAPTRSAVEAAGGLSRISAPAVVPVGCERVESTGRERRKRMFALLTTG